MMLIEKSTIAEMEASPDLADLLTEYGHESAIKQLPPPAAKFETYRMLEKVGGMHVFVSTVNGILVGFMTVLMTNLPHYDGAPVGVSESYFVAKAHRHTGAGTALRRAAEKFCQEQRTSALLITAPADSALAAILPHSGYPITNVVGCKVFSYE